MGFETAWLTDDAPTEAADRAAPLRGFLQGQPDLEGAAALKDADLEGLIALAGLLETQRDGDRLALLREASLPKKARKAVGKAIHRLESKGITVEAPSGRVGTLAYRKEELPSYISVPLAGGQQLLLLSGEHHGQNATVYAVTTPGGFEELLTIDSPSRTRLRKIVDDLTHGGRASDEIYMVEAEPAMVRARLRATADRHRMSDQDMPEHWNELSVLIDEGEAYEGPHPVRALVGETDPELAARALELLGDVDERGQYQPGPADRPIFGNEWQKETMDAMNAALNAGPEEAEEPEAVEAAEGAESDSEGEAEAAAPESTDDDEQRKARVLLALDEVCEDTFDVERRERESGRLLETAYLLAQTNRVELARIAVACADALADESLEPLDVLWCRESIHGVFDVDLLVEHHAEHGTTEHVHGPDCDH